jgi:hypothetical protein
MKIKAFNSTTQEKKHLNKFNCKNNTDRLN